MSVDLVDHPAVQLGDWLKAKRREKGIIARVFAGRIRLSPSKYAEVESGIVKWIGEMQENLIAVLLDFSADQQQEFAHLLFLAREAGPLEFSDIFTKEQLSPTRCCTVDGKQLTPQLAEQILDAVFTPLT
jgi:hypothetical protein